MVDQFDTLNQRTEIIARYSFPFTIFTEFIAG